MANLTPGVLIKLLQEMGIEEKESNDRRKPILLQIRSIMPVISEDDLWPNKGFFLNVSDSSHSMYVSLPKELDDMVLCNELQLGQCIYVEKLESANPVPIIKGIKPVPGRHPCEGNPIDLISMDTLKIFCGVSESKMVLQESIDKKKEKPRESFMSRRNEGRGRRSLSCTSKADAERGINRSGSVEKDSDTESVSSRFSSVSAVTRRRSWNGLPMPGVGEASDSIVIKHEIKPVARGTGVCVTSVRHPKYDSDDNSNSKPRRKGTGIATRSVKSPNQIRTSVSPQNKVASAYPAMRLGLSNDKNAAEISRDSLPSNLGKLGKEVLRQRDVALLAAIEGLQEASAAERLLKCLRTYSELKSAKGADQQPSVDKFFDLQKDLAQSRLIVRSLINISPVRTNDSDSNDPGCIRELLKVGLDRKQNATSWINAAMESDLAPISSPTKTKRVSSAATSTEKKSSRTNHGDIMKGAHIVKMQRSNGEFHTGLAAEKDNSQPDWVRGSVLNTASDLTNSLHDDCRKWFLAYVEKYLDEVNGEFNLTQSDNEVGEMMCRIKRVNDWLDTIKREGDRDSSTLQESELEACERVKKKIYGILLKNVERTAMAFEHTSAVAEF